MTTMAHHSANRISQTNCNRYLASAYIQPTNKHKSVGVVYRLRTPAGVAIVRLYTDFGSGASHGLTQAGLTEKILRSINNLTHPIETDGQVKHHEKAETRTLAEHLRHIRKAFGLNASDLSALLGVSRPTLYTWLDGQEPRTDATVRIFELSKLADDFADLGLRRPDNLVKRPMFENGDSLFSLLKQGKEIRSRFEVLRNLDEKESASRIKIRGSDLSLRSLDETAIESIPLYSE